jgi:anti-anti-sigma factor
MSSPIRAGTLETHEARAAAPLRIDVETEQRGMRIRPYGEVDLATVGDLRRTIDECVASGCERVVVDLRGVQFLDCTGLHLALDAAMAARTAGWELELVEGPVAVQRVFELARVRDRLPFVAA